MNTKSKLFDKFEATPKIKKELVHFLGLILILAASTVISIGYNSALKNLSEQKPSPTAKELQK